jgi:hypothetical protein
VSLSSRWFVGVNAWRKRSAGKLSSSTLSPKFVRPFQGPFPLSRSRRAPPGSTTTPLRDSTAESLALQLLGMMSARRFEHSVLKTARSRPVARSIRTT